MILLCPARFFRLVPKEAKDNDVADTAWYSDAVGFVAARGIATGTGNYSLETKLTRGQFIAMVMRSLRCQQSRCINIAGRFEMVISSVLVDLMVLKMVIIWSEIGESIIGLLVIVIGSPDGETQITNYTRRRTSGLAFGWGSTPSFSTM